MDLVKYNEIEEKIIVLRDAPVILDSDVAAIYEVETRDINKAVKNNPDKFPKGYLFELNNEEFTNLRWNISTTNLTKTRVLPKAFTEKGLYMLATILKSKKATERTIEIIETFAKFRELTQTVNQITKEPDQEKQKSLLRKSGEIIADMLKDDLEITDTETTVEINVAMAFKFKRTVKRSKKRKDTE